MHGLEHLFAHLMTVKLLLDIDYVTINIYLMSFLSLCQFIFS